MGDVGVFWDVFKGTNIHKYTDGETKKFTYSHLDANGAKDKYLQDIGSYLLRKESNALWLYYLPRGMCHRFCRMKGMSCVVCLVFIYQMDGDRLF